MTSQIHSKEILKESIPVLMFCAAISVFSGLSLSRNEEILKFLPGILLIVPAFMSINGNISSIITSRLSSALHMGLIKPNFRRTHLLMKNFYSMLIISFITFPILGFVAGFFNIIFSGSDLGLIFFPLITLLSGMITISSLMFLSIFVSYMTYRKGLDPDNVVVPFLTTVGDFIGITVLLLVTALVI